MSSIDYLLHECAKKIEAKLQVANLSAEEIKLLTMAAAILKDKEEIYGKSKD